MIALPPNTSSVLTPEAPQDPPTAIDVIGAVRFERAMLEDYLHPAVLKNRPQQSEVAAAVKYKSRVLVAYDADNDQDLQADLIVDRAVQRLEAHLTKIMTDAQNRFAVSLDDLKREIQQLQVKQNEFQADLSEVKTSVRKIATDLSGVKTSVGKLETDLSEVKHNVKALIHDTAILQNKNRTDCLVEVPFPQTHEMPWGMQVETGRNRSRELSELTSEKVIRQLDNVEAKAYFTRYYPGETVPRDQGEIHDAILRAVGGPTL